jgi:hypothetical protein
MVSERRKVQRFLLDGDVEVTIKFPPGAARWQSTQSAVSIATGEMDPPSIGPALSTAGVSVPAARVVPKKVYTSADAFADAGLGSDGVNELADSLVGMVDA